jgi:hypothetical protein
MNNWQMFGSKVPREEIVYLCQIIGVYTIIITSIVNLSIGGRERTELWITLLSSAIGYLLPNPRLGQNERIVLDTPKQRKPSPVSVELNKLVQN